MHITTSNIPQNEVGQFGWFLPCLFVQCVCTTYSRTHVYGMSVWLYEYRESEIAWLTLGINEIGWQPTTSTRQNKSFICTGDCAVCAHSKRHAGHYPFTLFIHSFRICCQTTYGCSQLCKSALGQIHIHIRKLKSQPFSCVPFFDCPMHGAFYTHIRMYDNA